MVAFGWIPCQIVRPLEALACFCMILDEHPEFPNRRPIERIVFESSGVDDPADLLKTSSRTFLQQDSDCSIKGNDGR